MDKHRYRAFTLIELLVVISIIALLISILLPVLSRAREMGRSAACLSNEHQFITAAAAYQGDHKGVFPYESGQFRAVNNYWLSGAEPTWLWSLMSYMNQTGGQNHLVCPTMRAVDTTFDPEQQYDNSYAANGVVTDLGGIQFKNPSRIVAIGENTQVTRGVSIRGAYGGLGTSLQVRLTGNIWDGWMRNSGSGLISAGPHDIGKGREGPLSTFVDGGQNYAYLDGHAGYRPWEELTSLHFGLLLGGTTDGQESPGRVKGTPFFN